MYICIYIQLYSSHHKMTVKIFRDCHIVCFHHPLKILKAPSFERCGVYLLHVGVQSHRVVETWLNQIF